MGKEEDIASFLREMNENHKETGTNKPNENSVISGLNDIEKKYSNNNNNWDDGEDD